MACASLSLQELQRNGLSPSFYAALYCKQHGELRLALPDVPPSFLPCPACKRDSLCIFLGEGGTKLRLPFWRYRTHNPAIAVELWRLLTKEEKISVSMNRIN